MDDEMGGQPPGRKNNLEEKYNTGQNNSPVLSNSNSSASITEYLLSLFICPACFDYVLPPILQCKNGHFVCSSCRKILLRCPDCNAEVGNIINLAMGKVASTLKFPCKYSSWGCKIELLHTDKTEHEKECNFRPCLCTFADCDWEGSIDEVMPHLTTSHSMTAVEGEDIAVFATDINDQVNWAMIQHCFGHYFMLYIEKHEDDQHFFAIVRMIGSREQAENFSYKLELNGHRRRLTWEATPHSIQEDLEFMNGDFLVFDNYIAQLFADNGNICVNVTINNLQS